MKRAIVNARIITPYRIIENGGILIENGEIALLFHGNPPECDEILDAGLNYLSPGFIDLHVHGGGGYDFMDGSSQAVIMAAKTHMQHGTTSMIVTTLTSTDEELFKAFQCYGQAKATMQDGPNLLGLHLEGPYFSTAQAGAQDPKFLRNPVREHYLDILSRSDDIVRVSAAPELNGALELGDELKRRGILAAIGHSDADYSQVVEAVEHGYTHVTHLYSGMSMLHRVKSYRHLGLVESAYLIDDLSIEIIADGRHLPPELLKLITRSKAWDKICLITDSMRGAGMPEGTEVMLGSLDGGQKCIIENGVALLMNRESFAGSVCTTDRCVHTMYHSVNIPLPDAVRMMTSNPAKVIGAKRKGIVTAGMDADLCVFDENIQMKAVFVNGHCRFGGLKVIKCFNKG